MDTKLLITYGEAKEKLQERMNLGIKLKNSSIGSEEMLADARDKFWKWDRYNEQLLKSLFSTSEFLDEYTPMVPFFVADVERHIVEKISDYRNDIGVKIMKIDSIIDRLELVPLASTMPQHPTLRVQKSNKKVFIVHGHDKAARGDMVAFLSKIQLEPIILDEEASSGNTIIEKIEENSDVGFAVVLLTPDDVGAAHGVSPLQPRARQNVIFELGYFCARLGRRHVVALIKDDVEFPSDYKGVVYIKMDDAEGWKVKLIRELKKADMNFDNDKI